MRNLSMLVRIVLIMGLSFIVLLSMVGCADSTEEQVNGEETQDEATEEEGAIEGDYKFALVFGATHPYFEPMGPAAKDAARDFNIPEPTISAPQDWDQPQQNVVLDGLVARGYNGIALMTSEPVAGNDQITRMVDEGVHVITFGGPPDLPTKSYFTLATDVFESAYLGTKNLIEAMGEEGNIVHAAGMVVDTNTAIRMEGVEKAVSEHPDVQLIQTLADLDDFEAAQNDLSSLLAARGSEINGIISTAYVPSVVTANLIRELDMPEIKNVGIDSDPELLKAIEDGYATGTMSQNPYGQAYLSLYALKLFADGYTWKEGDHLFVDSGTFFINKDNLDSVDEEISRVTEDILETMVEKYFNEPSN